MSVRAMLVGVALALVVLVAAGCDRESESGPAPVTLRDDAVFVLKSGPLISNLDQQSSFGIYDLDTDGDRIAVLFTDSATGFVDHYTPTGTFTGTSLTTSSSFVLALSDDRGATWATRPLPGGLPSGSPWGIYLHGGRLYVVVYVAGNEDAGPLGTAKMGVVELDLATDTYGPFIGGLIASNENKSPLTLAYDGALVRYYERAWDHRAVDVGEPTAQAGYYGWAEIDLEASTLRTHIVPYTYGQKCLNGNFASAEGASWTSFDACGRPKDRICAQRAYPSEEFFGDPLPSDASMYPSSSLCVPSALWPAANGTGPTLFHADGVFQALTRDGHSFAARMLDLDQSRPIYGDATCTGQDPTFSECPGALCSNLADCDRNPQVCALSPPRCVTFERVAGVLEVWLGPGELLRLRTTTGRSIYDDLVVLDEQIGTIDAPQTRRRFVRFDGDRGATEVMLEPSICTDPDTCGHSSSAFRGAPVAAVRLDDGRYVSFHAVDRGDHHADLHFYALVQQPTERAMSGAPAPRTDPLVGCSAVVPPASPLERACASLTGCFPGQISTRGCVEGWHLVPATDRDAFVARVEAQRCGAIATPADATPSWSVAGTGTCTDSDFDVISDADEGSADTDFDGTPDARDADSDGDGRPDADEAGDNVLETPPLDSDADGIPDFREQDADDDGVADGVDNCPVAPNADQADPMSVGGAACYGDPDRDGVRDPDDNCPFHANAAQSFMPCISVGQTPLACDGDLLTSCRGTIDCAAMGLECVANTPYLAAAEPFLCGPRAECPLEDLQFSRCQNDLLVFEAFETARYVDCAELGLRCVTGEGLPGIYHSFCAPSF